jgi:hypothetical protein
MKPKGATDARMYLRMTAGALGLSLRRLVWTPAILVHAGIAAVPLFIVAMIVMATWRHPRITAMDQVHSTYEWFLRLLFIPLFQKKLIKLALWLEEQAGPYFLFPAAAKQFHGQFNSGPLTGNIIL